MVGRILRSRAEGRVRSDLVLVTKLEEAELRARQPVASATRWLLAGGRLIWLQYSDKPILLIFGTSMMKRLER